MQDLDWTDLRHLLAVGRTQSLGQAARRMGVDATTIARRIRALERACGAALLIRAGGEGLRLTPLGEEIVLRAEAMASEVDRIAGLVGQRRGALVGTVRLTAVPILVNRVLVPALPALTQRHPDLTLELVPEARDLSLTRREADLALRLGRPLEGGYSVRMRRAGSLRYGVYGPAGAEAEGAPWILYDAAMAHRPHARWLADMAASGRAAPLRVADAETALAAIAAGLGRSLLPVIVGDAATGVERLPDPPDVPIGLPGQPGAPPERALWLLSHAEQERLAALRTVSDWLVTEVLRPGSPPPAPQP
ncbi:MAG: LysR family transcriptional regulator [Pseudomonadota bacterium]